MYGLVWGLSKPNANNLYLFPKWMKSLSPGRSLDFVYIRVGPLVIIYVVYYQMNWSTILIVREMERSKEKEWSVVGQVMGQLWLIYMNKWHQFLMHMLMEDEFMVE